MINVIPVQYRMMAAAAAIAGVALVSFGGGWSVSSAYASKKLLSAQKDWAEQKAAAERANTETITQALLRERALAATLEGASNAQQKRDVEGQARAAALRSELERLRTAQTEYAASRTAPADAAASSPSGNGARPFAGVVPSTGDFRDQLLAEGAVAIGELAPALQSSHERHTALVVWYHEARLRLNKWGAEGRDITGMVTR
jgi:hypothetical protein